MNQKQTEIAQKVRDCFDKLTFRSEREKAIFAYRFGINSKVSHTLEETGKMFGVTRERIRQIEAKYLEELRTLDNGLL